MSLYDFTKELADKYGVTFTHEFVNSNYGHNVGTLPKMHDLNSSTIINIDPQWEISSDIHVHNTFKKISSLYSRYYDNIYGIFTYGPSNYIFAIIKTDGVLFIDEQLLYGLYTTSNQNSWDREDLVGKLHHIFNYVRKVKSSYFSLDDLSLQREDLIISILSRISEKSKINLTSDELLSTVKRMVIEFNKNTNNVASLVSLYNNNNLARQTLISIHNTSKQESSEAFTRGFNIGTFLYSAFIQCGYSLDSNGILIKNLNIKPEFCIRNNKNYRIPEDKQFYGITKLSFDMSTTNVSDLVLYCEGKHPNVSGGHRVCIGADNNSKFKELMTSTRSKIGDLVDLLNIVETSLMVVNFDSAYFQESEEYINGLIKVEDISFKNVSSVTNMRKI